MENRIFSSVLAVTIFVSLVSAIGGVPFNTMPLLLTSIDEGLGLSTQDKANLSSYAFAGYLVGTLIGPVIVDRVSWRLFSLVAATLAALSLIVSAHSVSTILAFSWLGFGFFSSFLHSICMRILAEMPDEERAYGTRLSVELVSISLILFILPILFIKHYQYFGAAYALAGFIAILALGIFFMPQRPTTNIKAPIALPAFKSASKSYFALFIFLIYCLANVGLWIFVGVIAQAYNPSAEQMSLLFFMLKVLGGLAGFVGAVIGARAGIRYPNSVSFLIITIGSIGLLTASSFHAVMIATWIWEFGFTLGCIYQTAGVARFDTSNRLVMLVPTAFAISSFFGAQVAGLLSANGNFDNLYYFVIGCSFLPAVYYFVIDFFATEKTHAKTS